MAEGSETTSYTNRMEAIQQNLQGIKVTKRTKKTNISVRDRWPFLTEIKREFKAQEEKTEENRFIPYDIGTFRKLQPQSAPENRYARIGGYVRIDNDRVYLVTSRDIPNQMTVRIELGPTFEDYPEPGSFTEVFGRMHFEVIDGKYNGFIQMYFYRKLIGSYGEYMELLRLLKNV